MVYIIQKAAEDIVGVYIDYQVAQKHLAKFQSEATYPHHYAIEEYEIEYE